jgi:hypothetical protein
MSQSQPTLHFIKTCIDNQVSAEGANMTLYRNQKLKTLYVASVTPNAGSLNLNQVAYTCFDKVTCWLRLTD